MANARNVFGKPLQLCCGNTGFTREGFCYVPKNDFGNHSVCAVMTQEFLEYSKAQGNDLMAANPMAGFAGLKPGDRWCLCATRWLQAEQAGVAPKVILSAVNQKALDVIPLETLKRHSTEQNQE
ncbi:DUF2237 family protein [Lacimicrobium alkaliphilum]|uniref:DUF2237 domain-containing protein n=1 Tax=Lacimicrobium alkaliphilum TaxID=1526571 RepID=A0ABQ1RRB5_9ALTE|nr:DUF2237 domain-containing protein [Lacimicrobium alkaliphilum]GGD76157.1 hypothetical protein GCM10011357_34000 [Lacimicrobium alkaliphilum]